MTYGRSPKKPIVGRLTDLPWVAHATYGRFRLKPPLVPYLHDLNRGEQCTEKEATPRRVRSSRGGFLVSALGIGSTYDEAVVPSREQRLR